VRAHLSYEQAVVRQSLAAEHDVCSHSPTKDAREPSIRSMPRSRDLASLRVQISSAVSSPVKYSFDSAADSTADQAACPRGPNGLCTRRLARFRLRPPPPY